MSTRELERFASSLRDEPGFVASYVALANPADVAAQARADGFDVTDEEVLAAYEAGSELSEGQLDQISGGVIGELICAGLIVAGIAGFLGIGGYIGGALLKKNSLA